MTDPVHELRSERIASLVGLPRLDRLVRLVKMMGAGSEEDYAHDGFLSYHAETHAVGAGFATGFLIAASGRWRLLGGLLTLALYGNNGEKFYDAKLAHDIASEAHYFLAPLVVGVGLGLAVRAVTGQW